MRSQALEDLFFQELEELYDAEKQIYRGLGVMAKSANSPDLKAALHDHQKQTKDQLSRLDSCFRILGEKPSRGKASGVAGLIKQHKAQLESNHFDPAVADASLISTAQKIEHYEIAGYGCARTHAGILGYKEVEDLLSATLHEEVETDALLTKIAQASVNRGAAAAPYSQARTGIRHNLGAFEDGPGAESKLSLGKIAVGLAVGGALSVLFAPKPGAETRAQIRDSFKNAAEGLKKATRTA